MSVPVSVPIEERDVLTAPDQARELRVLILAPTSNDAELTAEFLSQAGMHATTCADVDELALQMSGGCGALVIAEESLGNVGVKTLADALAVQPPWSDLPITLITSEGHVAHEALRRLGTFNVTANVTLLERPFHPRTLLSTVSAALRSRRRQYEVRDLVAQARDDAQHLEFVLRAGGLGAWRLEWDTRRLVCSDHGKAHWGLNGTNEISEEQINSVIHLADRARVAGEIRRSLESQTDFEAEYRVTSRGSVRWIMARGRNAYSADGVPLHFSGVTVDVTERKQAEETLHAVSQRFRLLAEAVPEKIFSSDATGNVDYGNRRLLEYAGIQESSDWKWKDFVHASDVAETLRRWQLTITTGEAFQHEHRLKGADGVYRWHLSRGHAMPSEPGGSWVCIGCCTDIEDQKQQEVRLEEAVVARTAALRETIEELEAFSYSISHDMRQPLRAIEGYAQALLEDHGSNLDPNACAYLDRIRLSAVRLDQLIQDVLSYSRVSRRNIELTNLDLSRVVRETIDTYMPLRGVEIQSADPLGNVLGHEVALIQCLSNIMGNAVKFAAPRRKLRIKLWSEARPAGMVRLWIEDNGIGIRERDHRRIFDMFVQVHDRERYTGTGIGLTIVRKAIERMRGRVGVQSTFGKGSRFWIELPSA